MVNSCFVGLMLCEGFYIGEDYYLKYQETNFKCSKKMVGLPVHFFSVR